METRAEASPSDAPSSTALISDLLKKVSLASEEEKEKSTSSPVVAVTTLQDKWKIDFSKLYFPPEVPLNKGSFGVVYTAIYCGETVAAKYIQIDEERGPYLEDCENERDILIRASALKVSNMVDFIGWTETKTHYYFIMKLYPLGSLDNYFETNKTPPSWGVRYKLMQNMAKAVSDLHTNKIWHKDVKSGNFLLEEQEDKDKNKELSVVICDFGNAAVVGSDYDTYPAGSVIWAAPELTIRGTFNEKSETFSLCMTMWEVAAWKIPYEHPDLEKLIPTMIAYKVAKEGLRETIPEDCPKKIAKLINWGWQANPKLRPTVSELYTELQTGMDTLSKKLATLQFT